MKERKVITFAGGIVTTPSSGKDGEMKDCVNVMPVGGELRNVEEIKEQTGYQLRSAADTLLYVHKVLSGEEHVIYEEGGDVFWKLPEETDQSTQHVAVRLDNDEDVVTVSSMNNVLIILTNKQLLYCLWKDGGYHPFDTTKGRDLDLRFGLVGVVEEDNSGDDEKINFSEFVRDNTHVRDYTPTSENDNVLFGLMHKFVQDKEENNKFVYPFLVRYALKTKDGRYICPSSPALLVPNTQQAPCPYVKSQYDSRSSFPYGDKQLFVRAFCGNLYYAVGNKYDELEAIKAAISDVVDSVVIAVTPPLYTYNDGASETQRRSSIHARYAPTSGDDPSGRRTRYEQTMPEYNFGIYSHPGTHTVFPGGGDAYTELEFRRYSGSVVMNVADPQQDQDVFYTIILPKVSFNEQLNRSDVFRIVAEIKLEDLRAQGGETDYRPVVMSDGRLASLDGLLRLDDDPISLSSYYAKALFEYNSRLHLGNLDRTLWRGHYPDMMQGICEKDEQGQDVRLQYKAVVEVVKNNESHFVECGYGYGGYKLYWFYYPDKDAVRAKIYRRESDGSSYEITGVVELYLEKHDTLNGAYWFDNLNEMKFQDVPEGSDVPTPEAKTSIVYEPHTILGSEPFNPTIFASDNVINVGKGEIMAVSAISLPISEPFGKTPMVCFCTDGVWGLSLKDDGRFAAEQQLSGDILQDGTVPVQSDKAVFFLTEQGLKAFTGGVPLLVSGRMNEKVEYSEGEPQSTVVFNFLEDVCKPGTKMMWDYAHNFLHIFPGDFEAEPTSAYRYIYNVATGQFARKIDGWMPGGIVQSYPIAYLQKQGNVHLYTTERNRDDVTLKSGKAVTREEPFGNATMMKTLTDMRVLKMLTGSTSTTTVSVEVSNDRLHWYRLTSLRSHSWKWYRFALQTSMVDGDSVQGIIVEYETRRGNKMR